MITNHYGHTVDSNVAVTGVHSIHDMNWDAFDWNDELCLDCEAAYEELDKTHTDNEDGFPDDEYFDVECDSSHTKLIGGWIKGEDGLYDVDKTSEYSAIEREDVIQVVWSRTVGRHELCSPCYPGQTDNDSKGEYLGYELPEWLIYKEDK